MKITRLQMTDGTLVKIEGGNDGDVDGYIENYRKQHQGAQQEYQSELAQQQPMVTNYFGMEEAIPLPVMTFDSPAGSSQAGPASALVANHENVLPLPALTF